MIRDKWIIEVRNKLVNLYMECDSCAAIEEACMTESERGHGDYTQYHVTGELTDLLKKEGYKFTSYTNSDFYSDGLRFAGFTDFS